MRPISWAAEIAVLGQRYGDRVAIADATDTVTYSALMAKASGIAHTLMAAGIAPGDAVATLFRNTADAAAAMLAVMMSGAVEVPINPALGAADRLHCHTVAQVRLVLTSEALAAGCEAGLGRVIAVDSIDGRPLRPEDFPSVAPDAPARIVFTSGTTGKPKGAVHAQQGRWIANLMLRAALPHAPNRDSRVLLMTPFSHGTSLMTFAYLSAGASVALIDGVDPTLVLPLLESGTCDAMFAPPTVLAKIVDAADGLVITALHTIFCGTAVLKPTLYRRAKAIFGPVVRVTYGKSEVFNPITVLEAAETEAWYAQGNGDACVGWPAPGVEIAIHDENGHPLPPGETGEVMIRAQHLMTGYVTTEGFRPIRADGYHDTGDFGHLDGDGRLHLTGRLADVIKSGGYKISPDEVERELAPALQPSEIAVVGIPSDYWGEIVLAAVESPAPGWEARLEPALQAMTPYKRPRLLIALDELPRNGIGKIMRSTIRSEILSRFRLTQGAYPALEERASPSRSSRAGALD
ncbi:class I adenylate-forming enzyme family protein [Chelatococcus asaccharovorans]|uniref:Acyl-CoA synthetase (AMP-forming)/AMP-acid ligase II n=1 Tax=Chelatococcus asaccharovorans TaxID=28210 RepID=A0A2V3UIT7_9HYPH|nr:class I adenylate-forming enzyme family protein [Chelatococcus asaccharovorans]PXW64747.1 acyl-CoA synthetase (AMP-forming)/AMP-acid ligase II [Chelatococcus asaccharovorans]